MLKEVEKVLDTREKILQSTIKLIREKGFKAATTRAIAQNAGVNEVTIFRHFGNKKGIIEAVIKKFPYVTVLSKAIKENVVWDLEQDLYMIAKLYHQIMSDNRDLIIIMMDLKGAGGFPEIDQEFANLPRQLKKSLYDYFAAMQEQGKLIETNIEAQVMTFIFMNFGYFFTRVRFETKITDLTEDDFLKNSIKVFARGLKP